MGTAGQETPLTQKLREYVDTARDTAGAEERRLQFLDLVRTVLGIPFSNFELRNEMYGGRMYALLGNLVFQVKANLHWHPKEAEIQLKGYITELNSLDLHHYYLHQIYNLLEIDLELVNARVTAASWYWSRRGMIKYILGVDDLPVIIEERREPDGG